MCQVGIGSERQSRGIERGMAGHLHLLICAGYYRYWEKVFFEAVCTMLLSALKVLHGMLGNGDSKARPGSSASAPLFRVCLCPKPSCCVQPCIQEATGNCSAGLKRVLLALCGLVCGRRWCVPANIIALF